MPSEVPDIDIEVVQEFLVESYENLDRLDREFLALEENPSDQATLAGVFRTIHTIKGTCGFLGYNKLESVTHVGENLLSRLRDGHLKLTPEITTALLAMVDAVRDMLRSIEHTHREGDGDYSGLVARLTELKDGVTRPSADTAASPDATRKTLGEILVETGKITPEAAQHAARLQAEGDPRRLGEILVEEGHIQPQEVLNALNVQTETRGAGVADTTIRVDVALLDKLVDLVGELVLTRNRILQFVPEQNDPALEAASQRLNAVTSELQEGVMKTRMQPIGGIWSKFPRVVRDLSAACGKQIRVEMEGEETELDKSIIEAIKDPLTHLVRNSADHGIESAETRHRLGKSPEGRILLRAYHEAGQVNIVISDDGAGIDPVRIKNKAVECQMVSATQAAKLGDGEALQLIFLPGFSTAEKVTNVSGRGVGMDVVRTNIEKIGGLIELQSQLGIGTTVRMKIPLTLAIVPALIVGLGSDEGEERFAIPQVSLVELVRISDGVHGIELVHGAPVFRLRGSLLPVVDLAVEFASGETQPRRNACIIVLQSGDKQFGLLVDAIHDTEEIVVKPIDQPLKTASVFAGATILGDGKVALVLDIPGLGQRASVLSESRERIRQEAPAVPAEVVARQSMLVFENGDSERMAIPLARVSRLEEIDRDRVEKCRGRQVIQYRGQIMPLFPLSSSAGAHRGPLNVIVCSRQGNEVGLVVENIIDVVDERITLGHGHGPIVVRDRVTNLVDVDAIVDRVLAEFAAEQEVPA